MGDGCMVNFDQFGLSGPGATLFCRAGNGGDSKGISQTQSDVLSLFLLTELKGDLVEMII
jgi:hypothetical protein